MLGDGCLCECKKHYIITVTCDLYQDKPFFDNIVSSVLFRLTNKKVNYRLRKKYNAIEFNFSNKPLFHKLKLLGFPIGKKGPNIIIPKIFYQRNLLKYVVQGFFATDGSFVLTKNPNKLYPRLESQTIHKKLILQIHKFLTNLGMNGHFYTCKSRPNFAFCKTEQRKYKFQFNGIKNVILFNKKIGFINPKQRLRYHNFIMYSRKYSAIVNKASISDRVKVRNKVNFSFKNKWRFGDLNSGHPAFSQNET